MTTLSPLLNQLNTEFGKAPICFGCFRGCVSTLPVGEAKKEECENQAEELEGAHALALAARDTRLGEMYVK